MAGAIIKSFSKVSNATGRKQNTRKNSGLVAENFLRKFYSPAPAKIK